MGSWEFLAAEVTPGCLDHIGSYGFFVEETEWELRIARDRHEVAKAYVKLANVSGGDDARYARNQKKAAKKVVVYLLAVLAERKWQRDHYVRYAYEMREGSRSIMDPKAREIRADEIARERVGPRPVVPDEPSEYSNLELRWQHTSLDPDHTWRG